MYIVDRIEEEIAVIECDDNKFIKISVYDIDNIKEGDILSKEGEKFVVDEIATAKRKEYIHKLQDMIKNK